MTTTGHTCVRYVRGASKDKLSTPLTTVADCLLHVSRFLQPLHPFQSNILAGIAIRGTERLQGVPQWDGSPPSGHSIGVLSGTRFWSARWKVLSIDSMIASLDNRFLLVLRLPMILQTILHVTRTAWAELFAGFVIGAFLRGASTTNKPQSADASPAGSCVFPASRAPPLRCFRSLQTETHGERPLKGKPQ